MKSNKSINVESISCVVGSSTEYLCCTLHMYNHLYNSQRLVQLGSLQLLIQPTVTGLGALRLILQNEAVVIRLREGLKPSRLRETFDALGQSN